MLGRGGRSDDHDFHDFLGVKVKWPTVKAVWRPGGGLY